MNWKRAAFSISAANLIISPAWIVAFYLGSSFDKKFLKNVYHSNFELNHVDYIAGVILTILIGIVFYILLTARRYRYFLEFVISLLAIAIFFDGFRRVFIHFLSLENFIGLISTHSLLSALLVVGVIGLTGIFFRRLKTGLEIVVLVCAPLFLIFSANVLYAAYLLRPPGESWATMDRSLPVPTTQIPKADRTLAILFDGWDYDLTFEKHDKPVHMPNIRRFRSGSVFARKALTFGGSTLIAVPTFTTGVPVTKADYVRGFDLRLHFGNGTPTSLWSEMDTVFDLAHRNGLNVSVAAARYHQYCFLFRRSVNDCYSPTSHVVNRTNLITGMRKVLFKALPFGSRITRRATVPLHPIGYVDEFLRLKKAVLDRAADPKFGFVFVHLLLPHFPYFYDRMSGEYTDLTVDHERYFDQLALLDRVFGEIRSAMERANVWDSTNVLLFTDHPGPNLGNMLPEFESINRIPNRIPLLLKLAGQRNEVDIDREVEAKNLYHVLKGLFENRLKDPEEVEKLLTDPLHSSGQELDGKGAAARCKF